jgi:hypothetical protein
MSTHVLTLKNPRGWFAAGAEVQKTMTLLSDSAFKLFLYLCLNACRDSGILEVSQVDLARGLNKTTRTIRRSLMEMEAAGVLNPTRFTHHPRGHGVIRIAEAFWPYQTQEQKMAPENPGDIFVSAIRKMLHARACVQTGFSVADEILARQWLVQGITLERVEQAILMGCVRKYVSWSNNPAQAPIASLHYFESVLEEIDHQKILPDYWGYLCIQLQKLEALWKKAHGKTELDAVKSQLVEKPNNCSPQL